MRSRDVIKLLEQAGFEWAGGKGDHRVFRHKDSGRKAVIVHPERDVKIGLLIAYEKQSGIKLRRR